MITKPGRPVEWVRLYPEDFIDALDELSTTQVAVYFCVCLEVLRVGVCFRSDAIMAARAGLSVRYYRVALSDLASMGKISVLESGGAVTVVLQLRAKKEYQHASKARAKAIQNGSKGGTKRRENQKKALENKGNGYSDPTSNAASGATSEPGSDKTKSRIEQSPPLTPPEGAVDLAINRSGRESMPVDEAVRIGEEVKTILGADLCLSLSPITYLIGQGVMEEDMLEAATKIRASLDNRGERARSVAIIKDRAIENRDRRLAASVVTPAPQINVTSADWRKRFDLCMANDGAWPASWGVPPWDERFGGPLNLIPEELTTAP